MQKLYSRYLEVEGLNLERLLMEMAEANISIKNLKRYGNRLIRFKLTEHDYQQFLRLDKIKNYRIKILSTFSIINVLKNILSYCGMFIGVFLSFGIYFYVSNSVTNINFINKTENHACLNGENCIFLESNQNQIKEYLDFLGLRPGIKVNSIDVKDIEHKLISAFDSVSGCEIESVGTHINVTLKEAKIEKEKDNNKLDLIAPENGIVKKMIVSAGEAMVRSGDTVKKGQVLVRGVNGKKAIASVDIVLYYNASHIVNENNVEMVETGEEFLCSYIDIFGLQLGNNKKCEYPCYNYEINETQISINLFAPIKKIVVKYKKLEQREVKVDLESEINNIERELTKKLASQAGLTEDDMTKTITIVTPLGGGCHEVDCYLEVYKILTI